MATLNISIPENMREWITSQIKTGKYTSASDYLRDLVRSDQREQEDLDTLLLEGLHSGTAIKPDDAFWENKKKALKSRIGH
ncbi:type II toxin-antitoxin system ParD family antitoxin [Nitrospira defluvii]|nr:type II toxin-antitoxin system ParD family antitoxin [Nitrospira defluvii]